MLTFTDGQTGQPIWINPKQVSALSYPKASGGRSEPPGCVVHLAGGFEISLQEAVDVVAAQIEKRLNAY